MNSSLFVTTSFSFLRLDVDTGMSYCLHHGGGLYYGITRSANNIFVAARHRLVSSDTPSEDECGVILVFDKTLREVGRLIATFPLRDMHEIKWHRGALWITCSFDNMVAIFDGKKWHKWYPLGEPTEEPYDRNHFNSLMFEKDRLWVLAHNKGPSTLLAFDLNTLMPVEQVELGNQAHNIWREHNELFVCSSGESKIVGIEGFELETGGFPRGIVHHNGNRYIGISELSERKDRDFTTGVILVYNENWEFEKKIELPGEGLVLDLMPYQANFFDER